MMAAALSLTTIHRWRRELERQSAQLLAELEQLAAREAGLVRQGQAAASLTQQRALARQVQAARRSARLHARRLRNVQTLSAIVERLIWAREQADAVRAFQRDAFLGRVDWEAIVAGAAEAAGRETISQARLNTILRHLERALPGPPVALPAAEQPPAARPAPTEERAVVARVVDGDTIVLAGGETVRYIGIDAPELHGLDGQPEPYAVAARERNVALVNGREVRLRRDVSERDRFGRQLRYIYVDRQMVNAALVQEGLAVAFTLAPDVAQSAYLERLEANARRAGRGLWRSGGAGAGG